MPAKIEHSFSDDGIEIKICAACKEWQFLTNFPKSADRWDGLSGYCKQCSNLTKKARYAKSPTRSLEYGRKYYRDNKDQVLEHNRGWVLQNKESNRAYKSQWQRENREKRNKRNTERYYSDPNYKIAVLVRNRVIKALNNNQKFGKAIDILGCSIDALRKYLEAQFRDGMTWENHGDYWHIDHIRPCATYDLTDPKQFAECFNHRNLQPLLAAENMRKKKKWNPQNEY